MGYRTLSEVYDLLMEDVNYSDWADYLDGLLRENDCPGKRILDLGCGTGSITIPLAKKGYILTGVDISNEMLKKAEEKARLEQCGNILWHAMDITEPDLDWESYDGIIATFDVVNHLTDEMDVQMLFQEAGMLLADNGLFIFDIQTPYRLEHIQGNQTYVYHNDDLDYIWENHYDKSSQICYMDLTFFLKETDGLFRRMTEQQEERSYRPELLEMWLEISGFELVAVYGELTKDPLQPEDLRAVIVARRKSFEEDWSEADEDSVF